MGKPIGGTCSVALDGQRYDLRGSVEIKGPISREGIAGLDGVHGYLEKHEVPGFNMTISDSAGLSLEKIQAFTDVTMNLNLVNGKQYILRNAWTANAMNLDPGTGEIKLEAGGVKLEELIA